MQFVDRVQITVKAGDGGRGCPSFAQPPYTRYPYPDGGDGGPGGHVILRTDPNVATLLDFQFRHEYVAGRGGHGGSNTKTGKRGEDLIVRVPVGTVVQEAGTGVVLRDLAQLNEEVIIATGGRGGLGNATAHEARPGQLGEVRELVLELKLIADVGLVGFPNAGKSSLLSRISTARPKVAAYPFTTRYPVLGVVQVPQRGVFVACDIPGLIEGAHEGRGMGFEFLRHVERTRVLVHVIDMAAVDGREPLAAYRQLNEELISYSPMLGERPQLIAANKIDLPEAQEHLKRFREAVTEPVWPISCATGAGLPELLHAVWEALQR
jgi:GTP-binding protein